MEIVLMVMGKTGAAYLKTGIEEYTSRIRKSLPFRVEELPDLKNTRGLSENGQKELEGQRFLDRLTKSDFVILLDEKGKEFRSLEFASYVERLLVSGRKRIVFIIGGPYGFSEEMYNRSDALLSLSKMTFNHEMVRLFFTEQVYRAFSILRGDPYHHE